MQAQTTDSPQEREAQPQEQTREAEGRVVRRSIEAVDTADIGSSNVERGAAQITVRRQVVTERIGQLDLPTLRVCEEYANLNELEAEQLAALGVSRSTARAIVQHRQQHGPFATVDALDQVPAMTPDALTALRDSVAVLPRDTPAEQGAQPESQAAEAQPTRGQANQGAGVRRPDGAHGNPTAGETEGQPASQDEPKAQGEQVQPKAQAPQPTAAPAVSGAQPTP